MLPYQVRAYAEKAEFNNYLLSRRSDKVENEGEAELAMKQAENCFQQILNPIQTLQAESPLGLRLKSMKEES